MIPAVFLRRFVFNSAEIWPMDCVLCGEKLPDALPYLLQRIQRHTIHQFTTVFWSIL